MIWKKSNYFLLLHTPLDVYKAAPTVAVGTYSNNNSNRAKVVSKSFRNTSLVTQKLALRKFNTSLQSSLHLSLFNNKFTFAQKPLTVCSASMNATVNANMKDEDIQKFFNQCFDKGRIKNFVLWFLLNYGENKTLRLVEKLKDVGFHYASKAGISLGIDDLKIPPKKVDLIYDAENLTSATVQQYMRGEITGVERFQRLIDTWHRTSEILKQEVIDHFEATDILNPVYMMAFSGARGNISQVRQLVGMRGLMADPQGQILDFPIRSNFREGLTLTEYIISSYGARKGIVDTALRTANAGYLTRRLVDVAQHAIISNFDCGTKRGIFMTNMKEGNKVIYSLSQRIVGRILARDLFAVNSNDKGMDSSVKLASRNEEITAELAFKIGKNFDKVFIRSSLTCEKMICQLCYGWSLAQGKLVSIGEAVGVVAAQSIGEPGTQLTMRTFHTGGVFAGDVSDQIKAPYNGIIEYISAIAGTLIRTPEGKIAFLTKSEGSFRVNKGQDGVNFEEGKKIFKIPAYTLLYMRNGQNVVEKQVLAQITNISQRTNATDDVEFTIKAELEGQFYSKSLGLRERMVGPKLKMTNTLFRNIELDKIYEAWGWGYAWILAGKIYEFQKPSPLFPIIGDLMNTKSSITQVKWSLNINTNSANTLFYEHNKRNPMNFTLLQQDKTLKQLSLSKEHQKTNQVEKMKSYPIQTSNVLFFDVNQILFKKVGYILEIQKKQQFIDVSSVAESNYVSKLQESKNNSMEASTLNQSDLLFFIKIPAVSAQNSYFKDKLIENRNSKNSIHKYTQSHSLHLPIQENQNQSQIFSNMSSTFRKSKTNSKTRMSNMPNLKEKKYFKQFPHFLQWFPDQYKTQTSGTVIFETNPHHFMLQTSKNLKFKQFSLSSNVHSGVHVQESEFALNPSTNKYTKMLINKKGDLLIKERLTFLKKRQIDNLKLFWAPSFMFKVSNLISYSDYIHFCTSYNQNLAQYNSKASNENPTSGLFTKQNTKQKLFINLFLNQKTSFLKTNRQGHFMMTSNNLYDNLFNKSSALSSPATHFNFTQQNSKVKANQLVSTHVLKLHNASTTVNRGLEKPFFAEFDETLLHKNKFDFNFNKNLYSIKTLKSFCDFTSNFTTDAQTKYNQALQISSRQRKSKTSQKISNILRKPQNRPLSFLKSISDLYFNFDISNYLNQNYQEYCSIQNKPKFKDFLFETRNENSRNISSRAKTSIFHFHTYSVRPYQSFLMTQHDLNTQSNLTSQHNTEINLQKQSIQPSFAKANVNDVHYYGTVKKGWVVYQRSQKNSLFAENLHKKIVYPGQILANNIHFNTPVFAEYLLLNPIFDIHEISSLSIQNLPNLNHYQTNANQFNGDLNGTDGKNNDQNKQNTQFLDKFRKNQLQWVKNKKCRFYILENNENHPIPSVNPNGNPSVTPNTNTQNNFEANNFSTFEFNPFKKEEVYSENKAISLGILFQPVQEFHQMNDFELKQYTYEYNKTSFNLSTSLSNNTQSTLLNLKHKNKSIFNATTIKNGRKTKNFTFDVDLDFNKVKLVCTNKTTLAKAKQQQNHEGKNVFKRSVLINQSFDSLCKKDSFKNKFSVLPAAHNFKKYYFNKSYSNSNNQFHTIPSISPLFFTKMDELVKRLHMDSYGFNKQNFKASDWKNLGLFLNPQTKAKMTTAFSSLKPKNPKEDYSIISNILFKNYIQQYFNTENFLKKSSYSQALSLVNLKASNLFNLPSNVNSLGIQNQNSIFMVSKKPLNLSAFLLSYKNSASLPASFSKKTMFKLSYSPISNFDVLSYPSFSKQMNSMLSFYLLKSANSNSKTMNDSLFDKKSVFGLERKSFKNELLYWNFNSFMKQAFESPCFMFNLAQTFDMMRLNETKTQNTQFFYNPYTSALFSQSSITKRVIEQPEARTNFYSPFNGELVYVKNMLFSPLQTTQLSYENQELSVNPFSYSCMFLTKNHLISYYYPRITPLKSNPKANQRGNSKVNTKDGGNTQNSSKLRDVFDLRLDKTYQINDTLVKFLTMSEIETFQQFNNLPATSLNTQNLKPNSVINISKIKAGKAFDRDSPFRKVSYMPQHLKTSSGLSSDLFQDSAHQYDHKSKISYDKKAHSISLLGDFFMFGDQIVDTSTHAQNQPNAIQASGQIIHYNNTKVTIRRAQPIFISPKGVLHKFDGEFIDTKAPVITLSYQQLKTGDIIQGIPKVEQFFEARTTKRGRLFRDSLPSLLKALFKRYQSKMPLELAVRQSFYKIQQIIVDGVQRVYKSQGVTISDKHLEVIVKQMTSKVRILDGAQTGFFPGEVVDLAFVEKINEFLIRKITYEPLVLGITRASLEVDSFLSAASFQQTTKVLSQAAIYRKKDFLKGLKENVILGNLIPAGTGYLVYLDDISVHQVQKN